MGGNERPAPAPIVLSRGRLVGLLNADVAIGSSLVNLFYSRLLFDY